MSYDTWKTTDSGDEWLGPQLSERDDPRDDDELATIGSRLREMDWSWQAFLLEQEIKRREQQS